MASDQAEILKQKAKEAIDVYSSELYDLNKNIWENPELCFKEAYAHDRLTKFLVERGFDVTPHYTLDTAFRAECGEDGGLTVGLISEYDALPEVGHACGHNLIAESGVAAALGKFMVAVRFIHAVQDFVIRIIFKQDNTYSYMYIESSLFYSSLTGE